MRTWWALNLTAKRVGTKARGGVEGTTAHTVLVLPLEQFILNAFEEAPWRDKTRERERERMTAKRGQTEVEGEKQ